MPLLIKLKFTSLVSIGIVSLLYGEITLSSAIQNNYGSTIVIFGQTNVANGETYPLANGQPFGAGGYPAAICDTNGNRICGGIYSGNHGWVQVNPSGSSHSCVLYFCPTNPSECVTVSSSNTGKSFNKYVTGGSTVDIPPVPTGYAASGCSDLVAET